VGTRSTNASSDRWLRDHLLNICHLHSLTILLQSITPYRTVPHLIDYPQDIDHYFRGSGNDSAQTDLNVDGYRGSTQRGSSPYVWVIMSAGTRMQLEG
jgi:hypothetical protein